MKLAAVLFSAIAAFAADIEAVKAEPNLEKRSEKALVYANASLDEARKDLENPGGHLDQVRAGIDLCVESLEATGKNARRSPKYFKRAEIEVRKLIRRLDSFRLELPLDDREPVDKLLKHAHQVQDDLVLGIMTRKK